MNINLTLIGQSISFALFVWFCMHYVWPPIISALRTRQEQITEGLDMAERSKRDLANTQEQVKEELSKAHTQGTEIIDQANRQAKRILQEAKDQSQGEARRQKELAAVEIEQERNRALESLRTHLSRLVVEGTEKILQKSIDVDTHREALEKLSRDL